MWEKLMPSSNFSFKALPTSNKSQIRSSNQLQSSSQKLTEILHLEILNSDYKPMKIHSIKITHLTNYKLNFCPSYLNNAKIIKE